MVLLLITKHICTQISWENLDNGGWVRALEHLSSFSCIPIEGLATVLILRLRKNTVTLKGSGQDTDSTFVLIKQYKEIIGTKTCRMTRVQSPKLPSLYIYLTYVQTGIELFFQKYNQLA